jgi:hypothetical protein
MTSLPAGTFGGSVIPGSGVNCIEFPQKWPKIVESSQRFLQQSIDFHSYRLSPPAVLAYELDAVFSLLTLG